ncbi:MAG: hypothetical protein NT038_09005 [Euryarchaeota archaeon]|nr:hypothetical protein [Euryarchaeota archaeon]
MAWQCTVCDYVYTVLADTLVYPIGDEQYKESYKGACPKCDLKLKRVFIHKNPMYGKQQFLSVGWYCTRCKYVWLDTKKEKKQ